MQNYILMGNPNPSGPDSKDPLAIHRQRYRIHRGGVGPGKGAKDALPTKPGKARSPAGLPTLF